MDKFKHVFPDYDKKWIIYSSNKIPVEELPSTIKKFLDTNPILSDLKIIAFDADELILLEE